jgi:hypothetical protein
MGHVPESRKIHVTRGLLQNVDYEWEVSKAGFLSNHG